MARKKTAKRLTDWYRQRLEELNRLESAEGQHVMELAAAVDGGGHTAAGLAALSRELRLAFEAATEGADAAGDKLDDLARRRDDRAAGGAG